MDVNKAEARAETTTETTVIRSHRKSSQIERLFAFVVTDDRGFEGVVRRNTPYGTQPLICDDPGVAASLKPIAEEVAGGPVTCVAFDRVRCAAVEPSVEPSAETSTPTP